MEIPLYEVSSENAIDNLKSRGEWPERKMPVEEAETDYYVLAAFAGNQDGLAAYLGKRKPGSWRKSRETK